MLSLGFHARRHPNARALHADHGAAAPPEPRAVARRVRELGIYAEIRPFRITQDEVQNFGAGAIILSGGPNSVTDDGAPTIGPWIYEQGVKRHLSVIVLSIIVTPADDDDAITFIGNKIFTFISRYILRIKLSDILYTYVLCNVDKFNNLNLKNNDFKLCIELPVKVKKNHHSYIDLEMFERKRYDGKKKVNVIKDGLLISYEIIKSFFYLYFK